MLNRLWTVNENESSCKRLGKLNRETPNTGFGKPESRASLSPVKASTPTYEMRPLTEEETKIFFEKVMK